MSTSDIEDTLLKECQDFICSEETHGLKTNGRLCALLWYCQSKGYEDGMYFSDLCEIMERSGFAVKNKSRARSELLLHTHEVGNKFCLNHNKKIELDAQYGHLLEKQPKQDSGSLFEKSEFEKAPDYYAEIVRQINVSYDERLLDCCAVMIRRLIQSLIVEVYVARGRIDCLKNGSDFKNFPGMINYIIDDKEISLSKGGKDSLKKFRESFKRIADNSAHNRHYLANLKDIDDNIADIRLAVNELINVAFNS